MYKRINFKPFGIYFTSIQPGEMPEIRSWFTGSFNTRDVDRIKRRMIQLKLAPVDRYIIDITPDQLNRIDDLSGFIDALVIPEDDKELFGLFLNKQVFNELFNRVLKEMKLFRTPKSFI